MRSRSVITIGNFDGVHLGHAALVQRARAVASGTRVIAMAFDPHPLLLLNPAAAPTRLTDFSRRRELLLQAGADEVVHLQPSPELLSQTPEEFVARVVDQHRPIAFVEGSDFRFGRNRAGTIDSLRALGVAHGFSVDVLPPFEVAISDETVVRASSSIVRWLVAQGRVGDAAIVLGRPYEIHGTVVRGDRRGRTLGFPTANVDTQSPLPADGVYAAIADLPSGESLPAALSVGIKPTFSGRQRTAEAHIITGIGGGRSAWTPLPGLAEYHWPLRLRVVAWLRDQMRFPGPTALLEQLARDCERARSLVMRTPSVQGSFA